MVEYKCVAGPNAFSVRRLSQLQDAVASYGRIIEQETVGGWELDGIYPIQIKKKVGILAAIFLGRNDSYYELNMLVFKKDHQ